LSRRKAFFPTLANPSVKLLYIVTAPQAVPGLLRGRLRSMRESGFDVTVICSPGVEAEATARGEGVRFIAVAIDRGISPWRDLVALGRLWQLIRRLRPDICHVGTPKAGLLGGVAAFLARVPCRVYTLYGLRFETVSGWRRRLLVVLEKVACATAHRVLCVSESLRQAAISKRLAHPSKTLVLGAGSPNGVDAQQFAPTLARRNAALHKRRKLGIPETAPVIGFIGRLVRDKGVVELVEAYNQLRRSRPDLHLLLVGPYESLDALPRHTRQAIESDRRIIHAGFVSEPAIHYHIMDVLILPSHREGFPTVILEAGAAAKPVVAAAATGCVDAVLDGVTGCLTPVGDSEALSQAVARLLDAPDEAGSMGLAGQRRVVASFNQVSLWRATANLYWAMLAGLMPAAKADSAAIARGSSPHRT
jgi:glycosyltransferase involved in cell wall biosynthesis